MALEAAVNAGADAAILYFQLRGAIQYMPDGGPVYQVLGMENGHAGEHGKRGTDHIEVIALPGNTRVGITPLQNRVVELAGLKRKIIVHLIIALIHKM